MEDIRELLVIIKHFNGHAINIVYILLVGNLAVRLADEPLVRRAASWLQASARDVACQLIVAVRLPYAGPPWMDNIIRWMEMIFNYGVCVVTSLVTLFGYYCLCTGHASLKHSFFVAIISVLYGFVTLLFFSLGEKTRLRVRRIR